MVKILWLSPFSLLQTTFQTRSKIKQVLKTLEPRTNSELKHAVGTALETITLVDIHNWFVHGCYCDFPFDPTSRTETLTSFM
jgi:hypothetical protein